MTAYYNEFDDFAAAWLNKLIAAGHIAPGVVDTRSIEDVAPDDLKGFTQCHFFAGIGVWSYALRLAGWADDRPIWTGSCPCQPFSAAGKGNGFADERHLWPAFHWLIGQCEPPVVTGEQVASKDGLAWLDVVQSDMEASGYAFGAADLCAAGFGAPHIRQRTFWVANSVGQDSRAGLCDCEPGRIGRHDVACGCGFDRLDDDDDARSQGHAGNDGGSTGQRQGTARPVASAGILDRMADDKLQQRSFPAPGCDDPGGWFEEPAASAGFCSDLRPGPTNGHWRDVDWLGCRDGKWRPVMPGSFPLAYGSTNRVGRLRGYGNAIVAPVAQGFIEAVMECLP